MASKHMEYNYFNLDDVLKKEAKKKEKKLAKKKKGKEKKGEKTNSFGHNLDENVGLTDSNGQPDNDNLMAIAKQLQHNHDQQEKQEKRSSERIKISFT
jgi:hypothetical protein